MPGLPNSDFTPAGKDGRKTVAQRYTPHTHDEYRLLHAQGSLSLKSAQVAEQHFILYASLST
jgi:hypothetical protein